MDIHEANKVITNRKNPAKMNQEAIVLNFDMIQL